MPKIVDSEPRSRLLCAIGFMKFALSIPVLITMRVATKAKRRSNLGRMEQ